MKLKVVKFGGSSLANSEQFVKVKNIVMGEESRRYVIPSAPGRRFSSDTKITDMLYRCYDEAVNKQSYEKTLLTIKERYASIITELGVSVSLDDDFKRIEENLLSSPSEDFLASRGEYLCGKVLAAYLGYDFVDPEEMIFFDRYGALDPEKTNRAVAICLSKHENAVIPGFYGSSEDGRVKTFSRGGSDITGSIVARAVKADLYENWTDVSGFLVTDPRIVPTAVPIRTITYRELRELSYMGATVLHEDAIFPVKLAGIPINIRNTNSPDSAGTMIVASSPLTEEDRRRVVTGIAGKTGISVFSIEKDQMNSEIGFGRRVLEVFEKFGISFEHLPSGIDTMSVVVARREIEGREDKLIRALQSAVSPDSIELRHDLALIAVVGRAMIETRGTAARVFSAVANKGVNIRMIDQGSDEMNIIIGVNESEFGDAIRAIYYEFLGKDSK